MKYATMLAVLAALVVGLATTGASAKKKAAAAEAPKTAAAPINAKCPMSGRAVNTDKTTEIAVAFCCGK
ncbi:MAG: hypothetical protein OER86_06190, partial [Phycisphaerae bacterium]|nr:hypothetical protein [Phycisphaerae bacterium]